MPGWLTSLLGTNDTPTDAQMSVLLDTLSNLEGELKTVNDDIARVMAQLTAQLLALSRKVQHLTKTKASLQALTSPFRRLPDDILREIFVACLNPKPTFDHHAAPLLLTQISHRTRRIALTTPRLWASLHISVPAGKKMDRLNQGVQEWLSRSGECALRLDDFYRGASNR